MFTGLNKFDLSLSLNICRLSLNIETTVLQYWLNIETGPEKNLGLHDCTESAASLELYEKLFNPHNIYGYKTSNYVAPTYMPNLTGYISS